MSSFPRTPRTQRGAIVAVDPFNPVASLVVFQYNPDTMTRTLTPQMSGDGGNDRTEALRLAGPPVENIRVDVEIDATDQLANGDPIAGSLGIYPQLSSLEMLIYPKSAQVILNAVLMQVGTLEVVPATAPLTLFIWGPKRVLPVKLTEFTITEEAFDPNLNPIRAKVSLGLRVLSYNDLPLLHPGYALFLTHQVVKEAMAVVGSISGVANASLPR
ncbi:hypothetical protein HUA74_42530 [Myxococcus sp. CA051A]|uniref:Uncharacterized protein n=1 Tax=Myxococcus llanfairpwllgwyngyllgogerychwyrndrobwllllantysiliogogogochensis TaxID=2590453 RepID=A0A540WSP5_9BACT|nr:MULTISPECIES: hypothetical protein [Myxococcus]NTX07788.1 hypothetical protein [Myxococcus sp. CA040A]NTX52459.1 hypothetical protein [Myxococcus sp. CA039A]NTX67348.1 hypothetical protein [Myxococcus sp. CA051A]TQF12058.1 hypothetical protein FJV41_31095 [Myxococcus llanfairpwllgwyngyllgogerychwyrndrobwllllantysiliogogogochensis]